MELIALEGLDKAGKAFQLKQLYKALSEQGMKVATLTFPRYSTHIGKAIRAYLEGDERPFDPIAFQLLQIADKQAAQEYIQDLDANDYDVLLIDRYVGSVYAYGLAYGMHYQYIEDACAHLLYPDLQIHIDIPAEESVRRKGKYPLPDLIEIDKSLLELVRHGYRVYRNVANSHSKHVLVDGMLDENTVTTTILDEIARTGIGKTVK